MVITEYLSLEYLETKNISIDKTLGYEYVWDTNHPLNSGGKVWVHRHIASVIIGRWLETKEHVHHIDGNKRNNAETNLKVLSSSEHGRLEQAEKGNVFEKVYCLNCGKLLTNPKEKSKTRLCSNCYTLSTRKFNPSKEELEKLVWEMSTIKVAKLFNVSDKAVERRCKILGIEKPPRGYWEKVYHGKK